MGSWIKDRILLVDLGFYKTQLFARVEENGGYFVSRIRKNMDPVIVSIEEGVPKTKRNEFIGKTLNECTAIPVLVNTTSFNLTFFDFVFEIYTHNTKYVKNVTHNINIFELSCNNSP